MKIKIEFEIDIPQAIIDQIDISEITKVLENHECLELVTV